MTGQDAHEEQLAKLYDRFTKFFGLLDSSNENERTAALHRAWKAIQDINTLEAEIYPEGQRSKLSFATVFEKAAGGGETGVPDLDDALAANAALKESEMVALARLERVEFLYREMKKKAYTELLKDGAVSRSTVKGFQKYTADMARTVDSLEKTFGPLLQTLNELKDGRDDRAEAALAADPLLLMLHRALREEPDFVRILAEGRTGPIPLRERIARALVDIPLDEKDIVVWRRLHAAQTQVIEEQQDALSGMGQMPDMIRDLKETLLVMEAERETDSVPRATHDQALSHLDGMQAELSESRDRQKDLETENAALKKTTADMEKLREQISVLAESVHKKDGAIDRLYGKRRDTLRRLRQYARKMRHDLSAAHEVIAALQTGDLQNIIGVLKKQGTLTDTERAENEKLVKALEKKVSQRDAELKILQERINLWVTEHKEQEEKIRALQKKAVMKYGLGAAFAAAAMGTGFVAANAINALLGSSAVENPLHAIVIVPALLIGTVGAVVGTAIGASEDGLKGAVFGGLAGGIGGTLLTGMLFAIPAGLLSGWADGVSNRYCPADNCERIRRMQPAPAQTKIQHDGNRIVIELAPQTAPAP